MSGQNRKIHIMADMSEYFLKIPEDSRDIAGSADCTGTGKSAAAGQDVISAALSPPSGPRRGGGAGKYGASRWDSDQTYKFGYSSDRSSVYSIDTPPPTVSGSLACRACILIYAHRYYCKRYKRMRGFDVYYPMDGMTTASLQNGVSRTITVCA